VWLGEYSLYYVPHFNPFLDHCTPVLYEACAFFMRSRFVEVRGGLLVRDVGFRPDPYIIERVYIVYLFLDCKVLFFSFVLGFGVGIGT